MSSARPAHQAKNFTIVNYLLDNRLRLLEIPPYRFECDLLGNSDFDDERKPFRPSRFAFIASIRETFGRSGGAGKSQSGGNSGETMDSKFGGIGTDRGSGAAKRDGRVHFRFGRNNHSRRRGHGAFDIHSH